MRFYLHEPGQLRKDRLLSFFITFNTAFYVGTDSLVFKKNQIDMLKKDTQSKIADLNFELFLDISFCSDSCDQMRRLQCFRILMQKRGYIVKQKRNFEIISEGSCEGKLFMILAGSVECVVHDPKNLYGEAYCQPFGHVSAASNANYTPTSCMVGNNAIVGYMQFLNEDTSMTHRVKSDDFKAIVLDVNFATLEKYDFNSEVGAYHFPCFDKPEVITSWNIPELFVLFRGLALHLAMRLSFIKKEGFRLSAQREFDHCDWLDDMELLRSDLLRHFKLSVTEKVLFTSKCFVQSEMKSRHRSRIIILKKHIVIDPAVFGPYVSSAARKIRFTEVLLFQLTIFDCILSFDFHCSDSVCKYEQRFESKCCDTQNSVSRQAAGNFSTKFI